MDYLLNLRCNICLTDIDEKEVESHIITQQHLQNKSKSTPKGRVGRDKSVVNMWNSSLEL